MSELDSTKNMMAIDVRIPDPQSVNLVGTAWYRIPHNMREFLKTCSDKHGIIGFEYDYDTLNFGVILGKQKDSGSKILIDEPPTSN